MPSFPLDLPPNLPQDLSHVPGSQQLLMDPPTPARRLEPPRIRLDRRLRHLDHVRPQVRERLSARRLLGAVIAMRSCA